MESNEDSVQWFEFLLAPNLLDKHLNNKNADPSPVNLIIKFIHNRMKRTENCASEGENADSITQEILDKKKHFLTILPLQVAAFLNWDLVIFQQKLPLHIQDSLLIALLHETLEENCNPNSHGLLDTGPLLPHQLFSVSLYHRYSLSALVKAKLPSKPIKVSNVQIPGQQDLLHESGEVYEGIITTLEKGAENSTRILEQLLTAGEVRAPTSKSFSLTSVTNNTSSIQLDKNKLVPDEQFKYQIHYELGNYLFLQENFTEALHHFSEALKLRPEISINPEFCYIDEKKLHGFYSCCSAICGRTTPLAKRTLYDRFTHSVSNEYSDLLDILIEDNLICEIPLYMRQTLQLELLTNADKIPKGLLFHLQTVNAIGDVLQGRIWNNSYLFTLLAAGITGAQYLIQLLACKLSQYSPIQRWRVRTFIETLAMNCGVREILVKTLMACAPLASLFSHEEIVSLLPGSEDKKLKDFPKVFESSYGADYNDINDIIWDLIYSYDHQILEKAFECYIKAQLPRLNMVKKEVLELNLKWEGLIPIPVRNALSKVVKEPHKGFLLMLTAKAQELAMARCFLFSTELLQHVSTLIAMKTKDFSRPCKMIGWMILSVKIQKQIHDLPCVDENEIRNLTIEAKQCLSCWNNNRDSIVPWTAIIDWCIILLLNTQDWNSFSNNLVPVKSFPIMYVLKPLAAAVQALNEKLISKKAWIDLFDGVCEIMSGNSLQKRNSSGQLVDRYRDFTMNRTSFLELLENVKEPFCLSILISLFGHLYNTLTMDQSSSLHIDHKEFWPSAISSNIQISVIEEVLDFLIDHATKIYPFASHPILPMCSSWFLTKADLAYNRNDYHKTIKNYIAAIFMATDYLRNDTNKPEQNLMHHTIIKRMIKSCMQLHYFTQAAILCQFIENVDYNTAMGCLQERNALDAMDAYYDCLYDVTLMEFIINLHQKRGEIQRRDSVMKIIGSLELNSNNNEEIQCEAAKVRKHRFLRALAKQFM